MAGVTTLNEYSLTSLHNTTLQTTKGPTEEWFRYAVGAIRTSFLPVILVGTVTNILNLIVFTRPEMRSLSTTVYLLALAVADLGVMYFELFRIWFEWMDNLVDPELYFSDTYCKLGNYLNVAFRDYANWLIACITVERVVILVSPLKAKIFCTVRRARIISTAVAFVIFTSHIHFLVLSSAIKTEGWVCWQNPTSALAPVVTAWVEFILGNTVVIFVFVLNIVLAVLVIREGSSSIQSTKDDRMEQTRRLTSMMVALGVLFLICELPRVVMAVVFKYQEKTYSNRLAMNSTFLLSGVNHACNFFLYVLSGQKFRDILVSILSCKNERSSITGSNSTLNTNMSQSNISINNQGHGHV